jgi:hypothetical protein
MVATHQLISNHPVNNLIIGGASITDSPWFTWADFLTESTKLPFIDLSSRGVGNEYIVASIVKNVDKITKNSLVVIMLTNVDKFDWYVENAKFCELQKEKHQPKIISEKSGFWCTGSWFPDDKAIFKELFYSYDYFCVKTLQQIILLNQICNSKECNLLILFDSPIWQYPEQTINQIGLEGLDPLSLDLDLTLPYFDQWKSLVHTSIINNTDTSLLGFCWQKNLQWYNSIQKGHPPASSHYKFFQQIINPAISNIIDIHDLNFLYNKIDKFDQLWKVTS